MTSPCRKTLPAQRLCAQAMVEHACSCATRVATGRAIPIDGMRRHRGDAWSWPTTTVNGRLGNRRSPGVPPSAAGRALSSQQLNGDLLYRHRAHGEPALHAELHRHTAAGDPFDGPVSTFRTLRDLGYGNRSRACLAAQQLFELPSPSGGTPVSIDFRYTLRCWARAPAMWRRR